MTDFGCGIICMLILFRCASGIAEGSQSFSFEASHLHIFTSSHLHVGVEVAVHLPGKGVGDVGNYILFPSSLYELPIREKGRV